MSDFNEMMSETKLINNSILTNMEKITPLRKLQTKIPILKLSNSYQLIPIELIIYSYRNKFIRPFQLYVFLKAISSGKIRLTKSDISHIAGLFGLKSARAITNNLKLLISKKWISYCNRSSYYFIRGYDKVGLLNEVNCLKRAEFDARKISEFKAFLGGAIISYLVNRQKWAKWLRERKNGRSLQSFHKPTIYFPVASLTLAKLLCISISTAFELKALAVRFGYVSVKKNFTHTGLTKSNLNQFKRTMPEIAHRVRIRRKKIVIQDTDTFCPGVRLKKRKKIETKLMGVKREIDN